MLERHHGYAIHRRAVSFSITSVAAAAVAATEVAMMGGRESVAWRVALEGERVKFVACDHMLRRGA